MELRNDAIGEQALEHRDIADPTVEMLASQLSQMDFKLSNEMTVLSRLRHMKNSHFIEQFEIPLFTHTTTDSQTYVMYPH